MSRLLSLLILLCCLLLPAAGAPARDIGPDEARQVLAQMELIEEKYLGSAPVKHQFCVSAQHYSFAVEAFVELLKEYGGEEYDFRIRETQTYEIIEDVAKLRSEVGD